MNTCHLLVVDDDRFMATVLTTVLKEFGQVETASSGADALLRLGSGPLPDLILLDAVMPGMNGFEVLSRLKSDPVLSKIPVIFVTALADRQAETEALSEGAVDFISKPFNHTVVKARIKTHLTLLAQWRALQSVNLDLEKRVAEKTSAIDLLLKTIPDPIWFRSETGALLAVNPAAEQAFAHLNERGINSPQGASFSAEVMQEMAAQDQEVIAAGEQRRYDLESHSSATGRRRVWEIIKAPVVNDAGESMGVLGIARDITMRNETELQLRQLSLAVEQNPSAILISDTAGVIEYVNAAFTLVSGYGAAEAVGRKAGFTRSGKTPAATYVEMWSTLKKGVPWRGRFINLHRDGTESIVLAHISPIRNVNGQITHYLSIQEDVTWRVQMTDEVKRSRAAQEAAEIASESKSLFLANMSHEIRTPMNAVIGLTYLLRQEPNSPRQAATLAKITEAAEHLLGVINDILDISKIEAGYLELASIDFRLADIIKKVSALVAVGGGKKGLRFVVDMTGVPPLLHGDALHLTQILLNYVGNAIKFTRAGTITLTGSVVEETDFEVFLRFTVEDTGIGIAPEHLPRLFQAFEQADNSTTRKYGGTGLGLKISRQLAQLMGGDAGVESIPGLGSKFWVTLRFGKISAMSVVDESLVIGLPADLVEQIKANFANAPVLLAEDNPVNQEVALALLRKAGLVVTLVDDGRQAVEAAKAQVYQMILLDMQMPELDGLAASRLIRHLPGYATTPIVAMTANAFSEDRRDCLAAGMNDHLAKPVDPAVFYATLLRWLSAGQGVALAEPNLPAPCGAPPCVTETPRFDYSIGLKQMSGNAEVYKRFLGQFVSRAEPEMDAVRGQIEAGNFDGARRFVHKLKGSAGTLGAMRLNELAGALEAVLKAGHDRPAIAQHFSALAEEYLALAELTAGYAMSAASR